MFGRHGCTRQKSYSHVLRSNNRSLHLSSWTEHSHLITHRKSFTCSPVDNLGHPSSPQQTDILTGTPDSGLVQHHLTHRFTYNAILGELGNCSFSKTETIATGASWVLNSVVHTHTFQDPSLLACLDLSMNPRNHSSTTTWFGTTIQSQPHFLFLVQSQTRPERKPNQTSASLLQAKVPS